MGAKCAPLFALRVWNFAWLALLLVILWTPGHAETLTPFFPMPPPTALNYNLECFENGVPIAPSLCSPGGAIPAFVQDTNYVLSAYVFCSSSVGVSTPGTGACTGPGLLCDDRDIGNEFQPNIVVLPARASVAESLNASGVFAQCSGNGSYAAKSTFVGYEDVRVPAGLFRRAVKVSVVVNLTFGVSMLGTEVDTNTFWFANGVGIVEWDQKRVSTSSNGVKTREYLLKLTAAGVASTAVSKSARATSNSVVHPTRSKNSQWTALDHTLATDNDKEFARIAGLRVENWLRDW